MPLSLKSIGGGNVVLDAPATASNYTVNIPTTTGIMVAGDSATGALVLPSGSTAERPAVPYNGATRWNSTLNRIEVFSNMDWYDINSSVDPIYNLTRSLRFRASASAYLNRTPAVAGNRSVWTWSGWVKRGKLGTLQGIFGTGNTSAGGPGASYITGITFNGSDQLFCYWGGSGAGTSTAVFRDPSAWYHLVAVANTTTLTCYINGVSVLSNAISGSGAINDTQYTTLGGFWDTAGGVPLWSNDIYLTEVNFIDGQALTPDAFGRYHAITGVWVPKTYTGTYGTNGFYLNFQDNSAATATAIGKDSSGNNNNWTPNNISVTAGVTYDSMTDVPTLTSATAANYCVLNPLDNKTNLSESNLKATTIGSWAGVRGTIGASSGKWYWEANIVQVGYIMLGVATADFSLSNVFSSNTYNWAYFQPNGNKYGPGLAGAGSAYGSSYTAGDVIGVALDMDAGTITFYKNNTSQGQAFSGISGTVFPFISVDTETGGGGIVAINFGQRLFAYTPPTGFVALNTYNLP